jgi:hypothetical protein
MGHDLPATLVPAGTSDIIHAILFVLCVALMAGIGQGITKNRDLRSGLLALAVAVSVGIHIGLTPEHLAESPRLGDSFIVAAVLGAAIAIALISRPGDRRIAAAAGIFCLGELIAWFLFVTVRVPFFPETPESVETIALISKAVEAVGVVLAVGLVGPPGWLLQTSARQPLGAAPEDPRSPKRGLPQTRVDFPPRGGSLFVEVGRPEADHGSGRPGTASRTPGEYDPAAR